ncbi:hypothetical protein NXX23_07050 [Bacteroides ovatus]|nr:hypothetical protein [Bacteroides ovatus]
MNTTIIIRQIKEYTGAYGKAYTLLYLIGAVYYTDLVREGRPL